MTNNATGLNAALLYLPGRSVYTIHQAGIYRHGVVVDVTTDGMCTVRWSTGDYGQIHSVGLVATHPDRPRLAAGDFYAHALGEQLARRAGPIPLAGFHRGHNDGRTAYTESARDLLAAVDGKSLADKHRRCRYAYVIDPAGARRTNSTDFLDGDQLIACAFFVDGPGAAWCGPHSILVAAGEPSSVFCATPDDIGPHTAAAIAAGTVGAINAVYRTPIPIAEDTAPAEVDEPVTEVQQAERLRCRVADTIRRLTIDAATQAAADPEGGADWSGIPGQQLREQVIDLLGRDGMRLDGSVYYEALALSVTQGGVRLHDGPRYSPAPDYASVDAGRR